MQSILLYILSCCFFACMSACGKYLSAELHPTVIAFLRGVTGLIICMPILFFYFPEIKKQFFSKIIWTRGLITQIATTCWLMGLAKVSLPSAMAVSFSAPLFTTIAAVLLLNEKISYRRGIALIVGFIGVLIILQPTSGNIKSFAPYSWIIATVICWALVNIVIKKLAMSINPAVILFYLSAATAVFAVPLGVLNWQTPSLESLPFIFLIALFQLLQQLCLIIAFAKSSVGKLQPFEFSKLIFATLIGYFIFDETMPASGWIGVFLIICSSLYVMWREEKLKKNSEKTVIIQD